MIRLLNIPREILDERNIAAGDVNFFELSVADVRLSDRDLRLVSDPREYGDDAGESERLVLVKVIDIFGNDTTVELGG